jgi:hypothetical protein
MPTIDPINTTARRFLAGDIDEQQLADSVDQFRRNNPGSPAILASVFRALFCLAVRRLRFAENQRDELRRKLAARDELFAA